MPPLDCPVHRQTVSQERPAPRPEEVPLPGRLMHHRAKFVGALSTGQNAANQTLGPARTDRAITPSRRRFALLLGLVFARELHSDRKPLAQPAHHLLGP